MKKDSLCVENWLLAGPEPAGVLCSLIIELAGVGWRASTKIETSIVLVD